MSNELPEIAASDLLGRRIRQSNDKKKAIATGEIDHRVFMDSAPKVSVDRLGLVPDAELAAIAQAEMPGRTLYGWAAFQVDAARNLGRVVEAEPTPTNPYHANVLLTEAEQADREARKAVAHQLALISHWRPRPE